jgi:hypothetical protein
MQCPVCNVDLSVDDLFCGGCGTARPVADSVFAAPAPAVDGVFTPGQPPPPSSFSDSTAASGRGGTPPDTELRVASRRRALMSGDELVGQAAVNSVYIGGRLHYEKERELEELDPLKSSRYFLELARRALLVFVIYVVGSIPLAIFNIILGLASPRLAEVVGTLLEFGWWFVMAWVFWLGKLPGQISEWKFAVDDKGAAESVVFDHIAWSIRRRRTPVDSVKLRRFKVHGQPPRDLLEVRQGIFYGLVSCFANGEDLYIGWTLWLYLSPARFLWTGILRLIWELRFRGHSLYVSVQFDRAKAFREAIHSAVREGVDVAAGQLEAHGEGTIGTVVPVVNDDSIDSASWTPITATT